MTNDSYRAHRKLEYPWAACMHVLRGSVFWVFISFEHIHYLISKAYKAMMLWRNAYSSQNTVCTQGWEIRLGKDIRGRKFNPEFITLPSQLMMPLSTKEGLHFNEGWKLLLSHQKNKQKENCRITTCFLSDHGHCHWGSDGGGCWLHGRRFDDFYFCKEMSIALMCPFISS